MELTEYLKTKKVIPNKVIRHFVEKGFINNPLSDADLKNLEFLEMIWGNRELVRAQISKFPRKERESFIRTVVYASKWERYVYTRFYNLPAGISLSTKKVLREIEELFCFHPTGEVEHRVKQIRTAVRVALHREKKTV